MSDELTPITRKETFLAKAGGQNVVTPTPITREETFLQAIIDNGSGGGGGVLVVGIDMQTMTLDKTWQEIYDASCVVLHTPTNPSTGLSERYYLSDIGTGENVYILTFARFSNETLSFLYFAASAPNEYPALDM